MESTAESHNVQLGYKTLHKKISAKVECLNCQNQAKKVQRSDRTIETTILGRNGSDFGKKKKTDIQKQNSNTQVNKQLK